MAVVIVVLEAIAPIVDELFATPFPPARARETAATGGGGGRNFRGGVGGRIEEVSFVQRPKADTAVLFDERPEGSFFSSLLCVAAEVLTCPVGRRYDGTGFDALTIGLVLDLGVAFCLDLDLGLDLGLDLSLGLGLCVPCVTSAALAVLALLGLPLRLGLRLGLRL